MFRLAQYVVRCSNQVLKRPPVFCSSKIDIVPSKNILLYIDLRTYLSDRYQAFDKWDESLASEILQKTNISM